MFLSTWETCPTLDAGILIMVQHVRLMMFSLNMVDYPMSFLLLSTWDFCLTSRGDHSEPFLLFEFCCGTPPSCLKVGWWVVVAYSILVSAQGPLVLVLGLKGLGVRVWGQGLTIHLSPIILLMEVLKKTSTAKFLWAAQTRRQSKAVISYHKLS